MALSLFLISVLEQNTSEPADSPSDGFVLHRGNKRRFDQPKQVEPSASSADVAWTSDNFYAVLTEAPANFAIHDYDWDEITPFQVFPVLSSVSQLVMLASVRTKRVIKSLVNDATIVTVDDGWLYLFF